MLVPTLDKVIIEKKDVSNVSQGGIYQVAESAIAYGIVSGIGQNVKSVSVGDNVAYNALSAMPLRGSLLLAREQDILFIETPDAT